MFVFWQALPEPIGCLTSTLAVTSHAIVTCEDFISKTVLNSDKLRWEHKLLTLSVFLQQGKLCRGQCDPFVLTAHFARSLSVRSSSLPPTSRVRRPGPSPAAVTFLPFCFASFEEKVRENGRAGQMQLLFGFVRPTENLIVSLWRQQHLKAHSV